MGWKAVLCSIAEIYLPQGIKPNTRVLALSSPDGKRKYDGDSMKYIQVDMARLDTCRTIAYAQ